MDHFGVRWTGQIVPLYSQVYTFYTGTNDDARLWVNDQFIIDKWLNEPYTEWTGTIALTADLRYDIKLEYYEDDFGALSKLFWSSASQAKEIIPTHQLYLTSDNPTLASSVMTAWYFLSMARG